MKRGGGKNKGSGWERTLCRLLSLWWTRGQRSDVFWRSTTSGAWATSREKRGEGGNLHCGDICAIDPVGQPLMDLVTIEAKNGYSWCSVQDLLDRPKGATGQLYEKWFEQAEEDCKRAGSHGWWLVTRRDRREPLIFMPRHLLRGCWAAYLAPMLTLELELGEEDWATIICVKLQDWLREVDPEKVRALARWYRERKDGSDVGRARREA